MLKQQLLWIWLTLALVFSLLCFIDSVYFSRSLFGARSFYKKQKKMKPLKAFFLSFYYLFLPLTIIILMIYFDIIPSDWFGRGKLKGAFVFIGIEFLLLGIFLLTKTIFKIFRKNSKKKKKN